MRFSFPRCEKSLVLRLCGTPLGVRTGRQIHGMTSCVDMPSPNFPFQADLDGSMFATAAKIRARLGESRLGGLIDDASHVMDDFNHARYRETPARNHVHVSIHSSL